MVDYIKDLRYLSIASRLKRLTDRFVLGGVKVYKKLNIDFDPKCFPLFYLLYCETRPISIKVISESIKIPVIKIIKYSETLRSEGLIKIIRNSRDVLKKELAITNKGRDTFKTLLPVWICFALAIFDLFRSANIDILDIIEKIEMKLDEEDVGNRVLRRIKKMQYDAIKIIEYSPEYKKYFRNLNYEWLRKYFKIEASDRKILQNPEEHILNKGGFIFFAQVDNKIIGTAALLKIDDDSYELAKMAVTEKAQGKQTGIKLVDHAINFIREKGAKRIILITDKKLVSAVSLYKKLGFKPTQIFKKPGKYEREKTGFAMILNL